jgi:K+-transporting ATPase c subunit
MDTEDEAVTKTSSSNLGTTNPFRKEHKKGNATKTKDKNKDRDRIRKNRASGTLITKKASELKPILPPCKNCLPIIVKVKTKRTQMKKREDEW